MSFIPFTEKLRRKIGICSILGRIHIKMKRIRYTTESRHPIYIFNIDGTYVCRLISPSTAYVLCDSGHSIYILMRHMSLYLLVD